MIKYLIWLLVIISIIVGVSTMGKVNKSLKNIIRLINRGYRILINGTGKFNSLLLKIAGGLIVIQNLFISFEICMKQNENEISAIIVVEIIVVWIFTTVIMYLLFGFFIAVFIKINEFIITVKNNNLSNKMLVSFLVLIMFSFFLFCADNEMRESQWIFLAGLLLSYCINIQVLLNIVHNPFSLVNRKQNGEDKDVTNKEAKIVIGSSILVLMMIIVNLYLGVLWVDMFYNSAFLCTSGAGISNWTLFYYTIVSFTTIGYGDIVPISIESQIMSVVIAITSVICLIIYISSLMSVKSLLISKGKEDKE